MALVDYTSSDSGSESESAATAVKRRKISHSSNCMLDGGDAKDSRASSKASSASPLPPLPPAFHDLYASTVRVSISDDPALHQGRKRVNSHKVGNWPSHLYIEWHPTPSQRAHLATLLSDLQTAITSSSPPAPIKLTSFLTSDLSAPQPLHISLSRPIALGTAQKDPFLSELAARAIRGSRVRAFSLAPRALAWHRGPESERTFLVLRVCSAADDDDDDRNKDTPNLNPNPNPELSVLLARCNDLVTAYGQPALYATTTTTNKNSCTDSNGKGTVGPGDAFHVSLAWTFAAPTPALRALTEGVSASFFAPAGGPGARMRMRIRVDGVKAKIGNVVTHVELPVADRGRRRRRGSSGRDDGEGGGDVNGILGI
ncbi:U6 snRNA phosphodiesterase Usb1 [Biscogniauxia marginata]|nr:U6 snRNA phosphodiesterase Usb1 [Biscogniauxia marginata]